MWPEKVPRVSWRARAYMPCRILVEPLEAVGLGRVLAAVLQS
jgi:hypothetical protein